MMPKHAVAPAVASITSKTYLERRTGIAEADMAEPVEGKPFAWLGHTWDENGLDIIGTDLADEWRQGLRGSEQ